MTRFLCAAATALTFVSIAFASNAFAADEPAFTPYRPSVSDPASVPSPGAVELLDVGFARSLAHGPRLTTVFAGMALLLGTVR